VFLETGKHFCAWCLYSWADVETLILGPDSHDDGSFLDDLSRAFESD
jgi:hypothetical protein